MTVEEEYGPVDMGVPADIGDLGPDATRLAIMIEPGPGDESIRHQTYPRKDILAHTRISGAFARSPCPPEPFSAT